MKKIIIISLFLGVSTIANSLGLKAPLKSRWVLDMNFKAGWLNQNIKMIDLKQAYGPNNQSTSFYKEPVYKNGSSTGGDIELSYFFNKQRTLGIGVGLMYQHSVGKYQMDTLYMDYQATDSKGRIYRSLVSSNTAIREDVKTNNYNIPILLQYKHDFKSAHLGLWINAGPVIGINDGSFIKASGNFNYEAIYLLNNDKTAVVSGFDNTSGPKYASNALVLSEHEYYTTHTQDGGASAGTYFDNLRNQGQGFNVGLNKDIYYNYSSIFNKYNKVSLGGMIQAGLSLNLGKKVQFLLGAGLLYQPWKNESNSGTRLTDKVVMNGANYTGITNSLKTATYLNYWINAGFRFYL